MTQNHIPSKIKKIYLMAICGTGMGSLAGLLKEQGYQVSGSDANIYPPMSDKLKEQGIKLYSPYDPNNLFEAQPDLVIVGNAISKTNPEAAALLNSQIPFCSMPQALNSFFLKNKKVIVVSGTHGKTTTTSIMSFLLEGLSLSPSFLIGGVAKNFNQNFQIGQGEYFVIEGDEYDTAFFDKGPKFLHYNPKHVIMTSLEFDHADIYQSLEQITNNFKKLAQIIPQEGSLHYGQDYPEFAKVIPKATTNQIISYGTADSNWQIKNFHQNQSGSEFDLFYQGELIQKIQSPLNGLYNAQNVTACFSVLQQLGLDLNKANNVLKDFEGIKRRQEILYQSPNLVVIDDFAHHPTAVKKTIRAIKAKYPQHHLMAIFEPRSNTSRQNIFKQEYLNSFLEADETLIAPVNQPEKVKAENRLDVQGIVTELNKQQKKASQPKDVEEIIHHVIQSTKTPRLALIMSNGGFDDLGKKMIQEIKDC